MREFPEFRSELHFVEQMVTEESVFCLPSKVGKVSLLRPAVGLSCYLLPVLLTIKHKLNACDLTCMPFVRNAATVHAMKVM
jgi:hypothetical protein